MKAHLVVMLTMTLASQMVQAEIGVGRSVFTTAIENKEPVSDQQQIENDTSRVYYFTELIGLAGHAITHRWEYNGQLMAEVSFQVDADRWRTWSSKNMMSRWTGIWTVSVLDEGGNILEQQQFEYVHAMPELSAGASPNQS